MKVFIENNSDRINSKLYDTDHWGNIHLDSIIYQTLGSISQMKHINTNDFPKHLPKNDFFKFMLDMEALNNGMIDDNIRIKLEPIDAYLGSLDDINIVYPIRKDRQRQKHGFIKYQSPLKTRRR